MAAIDLAQPARQKRAFAILPHRHAQSWEIYASLLFLFFYFAGAPTDSVLSVGISIGAALAFLLLYFSAYWLSPLFAAGPIGAIALLGAVQLPGHSGASVFLGYAASLACYLFAPRYGAASAAIMLALFLLIAGAAGYPSSYLAINSLVIVAVGAIYMQARRSAFITERLHLREAELASIHRASERRRIAHDLHDQLGQHLVFIALKADLAGKQVDCDAAGAGAHLSDIAAAARDTLNTVRRVVAGYSARTFVEELRGAEEVLRLASVEPVIEAQLPDALTERQDCTLALILREAVANVVRHAQAKSCRIRVGVEQGDLVLELADDGRGAVRYEGFGTDGMRERAARLGGRLEIKREGGTRVRLRMPLAA